MHMATMSEGWGIDDAATVAARLGLAGRAASASATGCR